MHRCTTILLPALAVLGLIACTPDSAGDDAAISPAQSSSGAFLPDGEAAATDAPAPTDTAVVLSFAAWEGATASLDAGGYVSPVIEDGGTCTLEATREGRTVSVTAPAAADATTTVCGGMSVPGERLAAGAWTVRLHYASSAAEGTSEPLTVEVPA